MNLTEKSAYIKGLAEGLELDKTTKEGKIIAALMELVDELTQAVSAIQTDIEEIDEDLEYLNEYIEEIDEDLQAVEDYLDEDEDDEDDDDYYDDDDDDDDDDYCDGDCEGCSGCDDEEYFEIVCPSCGETVCFDQELDPETLICPACGEKFGCIVDEEDFNELNDRK